MNCLLIAALVQPVPFIEAKPSQVKPSDPISQWFVRFHSLKPSQAKTSQVKPSDPISHWLTLDRFQSIDCGISMISNELIGTDWIQSRELATTALIGQCSPRWTRRRWVDQSASFENSRRPIRATESNPGLQLLINRLLIIKEVGLVERGGGMRAKMALIGQFFTRHCQIESSNVASKPQFPWINRLGPY